VIAATGVGGQVTLMSSISWVQGLTQESSQAGPLFVQDNGDSKDSWMGLSCKLVLAIILDNQLQIITPLQDQLTTLSNWSVSYGTGEMPVPYGSLIAGEHVDAGAWLELVC
jgi:hypothetical protein